MFTTLANETALPLQIERPGGPSVQVVDRNDEEIVVRGKASFGVELCPEKSASLVYGGRKLPVLKVKEADTKRTRLS